MTGLATPRRVGGTLPPTAGTTAPVGRYPTGAPGEKDTAADVLGAAATARGTMRAGPITAPEGSLPRASHGGSGSAASVFGAAAGAMGPMLDSGYVVVTTHTTHNTQTTHGAHHAQYATHTTRRTNSWPSGKLTKGQRTQHHSMLDGGLQHTQQHAQHPQHTDITQRTPRTPL